MGRHVAGDEPALDRLVDDACAAIGREIGALGVPMLAGVVLGGGYGRGEGGVVEEGRGKSRLSPDACRLSNDLDFFAITEDGAPEAAAVATIGAALRPVSERWSERLGIDVDFTVRTPRRIRHDQERLMVQELLRGHFDVAGRKGAELFAGVERIDAAKLPWMEAARLMMNRGMGLLLAAEKQRSIAGSRRPTAGCRLSDVRSFVNRNINKCILGAGDAFLVSRGLYAWRIEDRAAALAAQGDDGLYARAVEWKFRPREEPVCDWETAREAWLGGHVEVFAAAGGGDCGRTLRNAARWLARRRTVGELATFGQDPVVRVLARVERHVRARTAPDASLMRDWGVFN